MSGQSAESPAAETGWRLEPLRRLRRADADGATAALAGALASEAAAAARHEDASARAEAAWRAAAMASPGEGVPPWAAGPGAAGDRGPGGWGARAAWAERLELAARGLDGEAVAAGAALRLAALEVARCRAGYARAAAAAQLLDEARARWVAARRRDRERAAEAEADDRPWSGGG